MTSQTPTPSGPPDPTGTPWPHYSRWRTTVANLPYAAMVLLGAAVLVGSGGGSAWSWFAGGAYLVYGVAGAFWIMVFVCPYCAYYATRACPCGYGALAARLVARGDQECFARKFRRHIPVIVLLWLIPPVVGALALWQQRAAVLGTVLGAFVVDAFVLLPLVSRRHACRDCPQRAGCPWMAKQA